MLAKRVFNNDSALAKLRDILSTPPARTEPDGPIARLRQVFDHPVFKNTMRNFLHRRLHEQRWQHDLREEYRQHTWATIARDRPQRYAGISHGVNRKLTTSLVRKLSKEADTLQQTCDTQQSIPDSLRDPRPKLKVLRLLISGGLQMPERDHRHRRKAGQVTCVCKTGSPSLLHMVLSVLSS